jgi:hypothetical protein
MGGFSLLLVRKTDEKKSLEFIVVSSIRLERGGDGSPKGKPFPEASANGKGF